MSARKTFSRRTGSILSASALGLMIALTGCATVGANGGGTDSESLRVSVAAIQFETAYLADSQGFFAEQGLDVELIPGGDPASLLAQVVSGDVDIATGSWVNVATSVAQGLPAQVIGGNGLVDAARDSSGLLVSPDSEIKELADLEGKVIGVVGVKAGDDIPVLQALEKAGVAPETVQEVSIPYAGKPAALEKKTVDAVAPADSFYHQMLAAGFNSIANPVREFRGNAPVTVWTARTDWLGKEAEKTEKFTAAMTKAVEFYEDPKNLEQVRSIHAEVNQIDVDSTPEEFVPADIVINEQEAHSGIDAMVHFGLMDQAVAIDEVLWSQAPRRASAAEK